MADPMQKNPINGDVCLMLHSHSNVVNRLEKTNSSKDLTRLCVHTTSGKIKCILQKSLLKPQRGMATTKHSPQDSACINYVQKILRII